MTFGIICEFNPFHGGHRHLINSIKGENDFVICAMSGNFVQRGEFAVYDKYTRAAEAIKNGADIVIEIPTVCSTLSAQGFAKAGVKLLESTGICECLAFGAECDNIDMLRQTALLIQESDGKIREELKKGISYPEARRNAVNSPLLDSPNNILAIEYLTYTSLNAVAIKRIGKGHDSNDELYSASQIRKRLDPINISSMKNCESAVLYKLRGMTAEDFAETDDVSEGLENRLVRAARTASTIEELYDSVKTKRYTHSRIRRIILRSFLGITKSDEKTTRYIHILGFGEKGITLLKDMKKNASLPIITRYTDVLKQDEEIRRLYERECEFTDIHSLGYIPIKECAREQRSKIITPF